MNSDHRNIKFTVKREENNLLSFVNIKIVRDSREFYISVYGNLTFSGVLTNIENVLAISNKYNLFPSSNFEIKTNFSKYRVP